MNDRPSAWLAGAGVGLCLVAACGVVVTLGGWAAGWQLYAALFGLGLGLTVATDFGLTVWHWWRAAAVAVRLDEARAWANEFANQTAERLLAADGDAPDFDAGLERGRTAANVLRFFRAGDALGFALDGLVAAEVLTQPTWQRLKDFYLIYPESAPVLVDRGGNVGTVWSPTWTIWRVGDEIAQGTLPLPPGAPPDVGVYVPSKHNTNTRKNTARKGSTAAGAVIDQ